MRRSDSSRDVAEILHRIQDAKVAVFGDFCIDAYWHFWEGEPEMSIETGLAAQRVRKQENFLGGAGSVLANLRAMGVQTVKAIGVAGTDAFGHMLREMLKACGADISNFVLHPSWETMVYAKPYFKNSEGPRIDFGSFNEVQSEVVEALFGALEPAAIACDVVILNQQISSGVSSPRLITRINEMIARSPQTVFLVDSRHYHHHYSGASLKLNMSEAANFLNEHADQLHSDNQAKDFALRISEITGKPTFLTRGEFGLVVAAGDQATVIPGLRVHGPTDAVGAGDAVVAALAAAISVGSNPVSAGTFANIAAMITVKKMRTTGTASAAEILAASEELQSLT